MSDTASNGRQWVTIAEAGDVAENQVRTFDVGQGRRIAVARKEGQLYAVQDLCTHDDGPLGEGSLDGHAIVCPRHGAKFDIRTGAVLLMPAIVPIETFPVMEKDGKVQVAVPEEKSSDAGAGDDW